MGETLLVATRARLAILIVVPFPRGHWMTRWAPWASVSVESPMPPEAHDEAAHGLDIRVGGRLFQARLRGESGRTALRDFVVALRTTHPAPANR
jgi:hypothetical protein